MKILLFGILSDEDVFVSIYWNHLYNWMVKNLPQDKIDVRFILPEKLFLKNQQEKIHNLDMLHPISLTKNEYNFIFQNPFLSYHQKYKKLYIDGLNQFEQARLNQIVKEKLGDWSPDIIISQGWEVCSKILQNLYPNILCLNQENAFSSRPPFPRALAYDYDGPFFNFMTRFPKQIKAFKISKADDALINQFKSELQRILIDNSVYPPELMQFKKKFKKLILFPLVSTYHDSFFPDLPYLNDFDLLEFVFSKVPSDIGIVVSEHPAGGILSDETLLYFQKKYPNFMKGTDLSINYFPYVDAVLNTTSKTGLFSLLPINGLFNGFLQAPFGFPLQHNISF